MPWSEVCNRRKGDRKTCCCLVDWHSSLTHSLVVIVHGSVPISVKIDFNGWGQRWNRTQVLVFRDESHTLHKARCRSSPSLFISRRQPRLWRPISTTMSKQKMKDTEWLPCDDRLKDSLIPSNCVMAFYFLNPRLIVPSLRKRSFIKSNNLWGEQFSLAQFYNFEIDIRHNIEQVIYHQKAVPLSISFKNDGSLDREEKKLGWPSRWPAYLFNWRWYAVLKCWRGIIQLRIPYSACTTQDIMNSSKRIQHLANHLTMQ